MSGFESVPTDKLEALAALLRSSGEFPPLAKLERVVGNGWASKLDAALMARLQDGWKTDVTAAVLDGICSDRRSRANNLEWVVSGPSQDGVATRGTGSVFRAMIQDARSEVLLTSYSLSNGPELLGPLHDKMAADSAFRVRMVLDLLRPFKDTSSDEALLSRFTEDFRRKHWPWMPLPEVYYYPRTLVAEHAERGVLHAKCVVVDRAVALVTSANLSKAAQDRNIEVGVRVVDSEQASSLQGFFEGLIRRGVLERLEFKP